MRRPTALALAAGLWLTTVVAAAPAWAHATMTGSSPEQGARLDALPAEVAFEFSEEMDPTAYVVVTGPDGASMTTGDPEVDGSTITQRLVGDGKDGGYVMAVKAVSADGHAITGRVEFVVGEGELPSSAAGQSGSGSATPSPETSTAGTAEAAGSSPAGGRPLWVWAVGPICLAGAVAMWVAARRVPTSRPPSS